MPYRLPLPALLSQALVAFTIESDNEFEHRMPHRTTDHGAPGDRGPWLVSMAMWFTCMQFVTEQPMPVSELGRLARTGTNLDGMRRWGYVFLESASGDPRRRPRPADLTPRGQEAQWAYADWAAALDQKSAERFGADAVTRLRADLESLAGDDPAASPLMQGLEPYPDNWRADARPPQTLPHYPMVLHRGGYPDGS